MADNEPTQAPSGDRPVGDRPGSGEPPRQRFGAGAQGGRPPYGERGDRPRGRRPSGGGRYTPRRKICAFCADNIGEVDYKDLGHIRRHLSERGKIEPRRKLGTCAKHQRSLTVAIKRARHLALLPYTTSAGRG
ncbi:MAG: small subunit ribosomal protein [Thermomicrobiales bacterium]|nr:small subunit ribosomal protein [Thermomicrobiales bacterium]